MKKRSKIYKISKAILIALSIPVLLLWLLMIMLYMPPVQRFAVDTICREVGESSGFDVRIGQFHLAFPLKLDISDLKVSRGDTIYADGKHANVNISLLPLFAGEVEVNYVSLEGIRLNTMDLIPDMRIDGEIGFFRIVARNVDLNKELVHLRQLHLHSTSLNIEFADTAAAKEEPESSPMNWQIMLHRGNIENCRINLSMPDDTLQAGIGLGKIRIKDSDIDIGKNIYSIASLKLSNCDAAYDQGMQDSKKAPINHIRINNIALETRNTAYTPDSSRIEIRNFAFVQPGGIRITDTKALLTADTARLNVRKLSFASKNGSWLNCSTSLPWKALEAGNTEELKARLGVEVDKRDLAAILTAEEYNALSMLDDRMLKAEMTVSGNVSHMTIDTLEVAVPSIARLNATGYARNITDTKKLEAKLDISSTTDDIRGVIAHFVPSDSTATNNALAMEQTGVFRIGGTATYKAGEVAADIEINGTSGMVLADAGYNMANGTYRADIKAEGVNIAALIPDIPLYNLKMNLKADGEGTDIFDKLTAYNIELSLDSLHYDKYRLDGIHLLASQENSLSEIAIDASGHTLKMKAKSSTSLEETRIINQTTVDIEKADLAGLGLSETEMSTSMKLKLAASTDLGETHTVEFNGKDIRIVTEKKTYTPANISLDMATSPENSKIEATNGDMRIAGKMSTGYNSLFASLKKVASMYIESRHSESMPYYLHDYERAMPALSLQFESGNKNMLSDILAMNGIATERISLDLHLDTIKGLDMNSGIYGFSNSTLKLDTIRMFTRQQGNKIGYLAAIRSTAVDPNNQKQSFSTALYGNVCMDSLSTNIMFRDRNDSIGIKLGAMAIMRPEGLDIRFNPNAILLKNRFRFNEDNFINISKGIKVDADVTLTDDEDAGMHLFTTPDSTARYNAHLELFNVNLKRFTAMTPFVPDISGMLNLDLYFRQDENSMLISSDVRADSLGYEGTYIGNEMLEFVYLPKNDNTHYLDVILSHEEEEVAHLNGNYINEEKDPGLHGDIMLTNFPMSISKAFIKESGITLSGYINGEMSANGRLSKLETNGYVQFDSVYADIPLLGTRLNMADEQLSIENNRIIFKDFNIYSVGNTPCKINGNIDLTDITNPNLDLKMGAKNYELVNAPRRKGSMLYGKLFLDINSSIRGTLNSMKVHGNATLLNKTDITYVKLDAPIESDKKLDGLVEFVNFNDTTQTVLQDEEIRLGNTNINLKLNIKDGARLNVDFDENRSSYITLRGGGELNMTYTDENGIGLTGTYSMTGGQFKYALPVIPLKTFDIADGSKITWNGDMFNPDIDITALEKVTTTVTLDDNSSPSVTFNVGVKLSNTLNNMGLAFTLSAPENAMVQDQLNMLDEGTMNKYAATMLITGAYIGGNNAMIASGAISSFLDAKINGLVGKAMKSASVNVGINDAHNAETGSTYKNYSFSFSKRFWNDRLTIVIGGEVSSGDHPEEDESFINNVSLEWKISKNSNRYIRLFYDKNYESLLEGEIIETGVGYVYKRKLDNLYELFMFRRKDDKKNTRQSTETDKRGEKESKDSKQ